MAPSILETIKAGRTYETELASCIASGHVSPAKLVDLLEHIQSSFKGALLSDLEVAAKENFEERLWNSHQKVHNYYRVEIAKLRDSKRIVEQRKLSGHYIKFLKTSQSFYRGYIWGLKQTYGEIPELERCAQAVRPHDQQRNSPQVTVSDINQNLILRSCHRSLVQLGDLSRYRETASPDKERKWGPAIGYYELAESILPISGYPGNQLAVLQLQIGNNFKAIYHLYRSLVADEPHPQATENVRKLYGKLRSGWDSGSSLHQDAATSSAGASKMLLVWYLRRLEVSYHGRAIASHSELEDEVNTRLMEDLKQGKMDPTLRRIVLINCAVVYQLRDRITVLNNAALSNHERSYITFIRFTLKTFMTLLADLEHELDCIVMDDAPSSTLEAIVLCNRVTTKIEDILPSLRLYALWLHAEAASLGQISHEDINSCKVTFWVRCVHCFSSLVEIFPPEVLANLDSQGPLPEDFDILGFRPLQHTANEWVLHPNGSLNVQSYGMAQRTKSSPEDNLARIRDILSIAVSLSQQPDVPLSLDPVEGKFVYTESNSQVLSSTSMITPREGPQEGNLDLNKELAISLTPPRVPAAPIGDDIPSMIMHDTEAERMVDDLVGTVNDVGIPESINALSEYNEPVTPSPRISLSRVRMGSGSDSSSFPMGAQLADDSVEAVRDHSRQHRNQRRAESGDYQTIKSTFQHHSPKPGLKSARVSPPSVGDSMTSIERPTAAVRSLPPQRQVSPSADNYQAISPLVPPARLTSHSRGNSNESINSVRTNIWSTGPSAADWTSSHISSTSNNSVLHTHLGNGTFGTIVKEAPDDNISTLNDGNEGSLSTMGNSPWTARPGGLPGHNRSAFYTSAFDSSPDPWNTGNHGTTTSRILGESFSSRVEVRSSGLRK